MPKVSILMTSHDQSHFLARAVNSVFASTFQDFELLICDDSTDDSKAVLAAFTDTRVRVLHVESMLPYEKWNHMIKEARGEYIAFLPCDDTWKPEKLEMQVAVMDSQPNVSACFAQVQHVDESGKPFVGDDYLVASIEPATNKTREGWIQRFRNGNCLFACTAVYRRSLHDVLGEFDTTFPMLGDLDFYIKINAIGEIHVIEQELARNRIPSDRTRDFDVTAMFRDELWRIRQRHFKIGKVSETTKIMFATPFYENKGYSPYIRSLFQSVYALARHTKLEFDFQEISGGSYIDHNRNLLAALFLDSDCTHLLFIDSDHSWDLKGLLRVIAADKDIVGAAYPVKNNWAQYGVTIHTDDNGIPKVNAQGLIHADKVPTGFMKIRRSVFEKLAEAYPDDWYWHGDVRLYNFFGHLTVDHVRYGEDISFGIRWQRIGGEIWLEPRVSMGHYGSHGWYGNYHEFLMKQSGGKNDPARTH